MEWDLKMVGNWLKDLWAETWARWLFLVGVASNTVTFFLPGLASPVLHGIAYSMLVAGFLWANFRVYRNLRVQLTSARTVASDEADREETRRNFKVSISTEGKSPTQVLKVQASEPISVSRLEYLLTDGTCIVSNDIFVKGQTVDVPVSYEFLMKLWNTPRSDRNYSDHSGPAKFRLTISALGRIQQYTLPVRLEAELEGNTWYHKAVGSETFHGIC
jgi:hypothetical protein